MRANCMRASTEHMLLPRGSAVSDEPAEADPAGYAVSPHPSSRDALTVANLFAIAGMIEPEPEAVRDWYYATSIAALGGPTAAVLVEQGRAGDVLGFLLTLLDHGD